MQSDRIGLKDYFLQHGRRHTYRKGQLLLRPGTEPQGVYFEESGLVKVYSLSHDGSEHDHLFYGPGDVFPIMWAVEGVLRNVYYETMEEAAFWLLPKPEFLAFVQSRADISYQLLERTVGLFKLYAGQIDNLLYSDAAERVAFRLLALLNRYRIRDGDSYILDMPLTNRDMARSVATSRETVNRVFARFKRHGILTYNHDHRIVITDLDGLAKVIGHKVAHDLWPQLIGPSESGKAKR